MVVAAFKFEGLRSGWYIFEGVNNLVVQSSVVIAQCRDWPENIFFIAMPKLPLGKLEVRQLDFLRKLLRKVSWEVEEDQVGHQFCAHLENGLTCELV